MKHKRCGICGKPLDAGGNCKLHPQSEGPLVRKEVLNTNDTAEIMKRYGVSRATAFRFKAKGYALIKVYPESMPPMIDYEMVSWRTAQYVGGRLTVTKVVEGRKVGVFKDTDLMWELYQAAMIALWKARGELENPRKGVEKTAYYVARRGALVALREWRARIVLEKGLTDWLPLDETHTVKESYNEEGTTDEE